MQIIYNAFKNIDKVPERKRKCIEDHFEFIFNHFQHVFKRSQCISVKQYRNEKQLNGTQWNSLKRISTLFLFSLVFPNRIANYILVLCSGIDLIS